MITFLFLSFAFSLSLSHALALPWDPNISSPGIMVSDYIKNFDDLPLSGEYKKPEKLWSGYYWPFYKGGIDNRWFSISTPQITLPPPERHSALKRSTRSLSALSPAEKYDLFIGRYDYPLKAWARSLVHSGVQVWEGICHGWSPASINHQEPRPRLMTNPDGIEVPFSSSDIKALLSFYYAYGFEVDNTHQLGRRCEGRNSKSTDPHCHNDLNAGAFHLVLANKLGVLNESFIADTQRFKEVWNNPVHSFESRVFKVQSPLKTSATGTKNVLHIITKVKYVVSRLPLWQTTLETKYQEYKVNTYEYYLDLDDKNEIIGGEWISQDRPDFIWQKRRPARFAGLLSEIGKLLYE